MKTASALPSRIWLPLFFLLESTFDLCRGHGRLMEPPSRASMWRKGFKTPVNYNDNQLFCGGVGVQYSPEVGGKCGVCGDPWEGPREHEAGGTYATGTIVRKYDVGQIINVTIQLTANHKGYFEFRLCPTDNPFEKVTHECLDKYLLPEASSGRVRYMVPAQGSYNQDIRLRLRLPEGVRCRACLLQWKYNAGNSWGQDQDGKQCIGCGNQEQFYGCADVAIGYDDVVLGEPAVRHPWYFQEEGSDWHFGVVKIIGKGSPASGANRRGGDITGFHFWCFLWICLLSIFISSGRFVSG